MEGLKLVKPQFNPPLDDEFRPAALANRAFQQEVAEVGVPLVISLERNHTELSRFETMVFPEGHVRSDANYRYVERLFKFLLWQRGGYKVYIYREIVTALKTAAARLPRVDAIGGSSAGIYIDNCPMAAPIFLGIPAARYAEVSNLFHRIRDEMGVPLEVINDGDVTDIYGHVGAVKFWQSMGIYLGYALAHYAHFYEIKHVLILGRCTSGLGGNLILEGTKAVLQAEFPDLAAHLQVQLPDERSRRVGQSIAAASSPAILS